MGFSMQKRTATVDQRYEACAVTVGQEFNVHDKDIRVLLALGRIAPFKGEHGYVERDSVAAPPKEYKTVAMTAQAPSPRAAEVIVAETPVAGGSLPADAVPAPAPEVSEQKRGYKRKAS